MYSERKTVITSRMIGDTTITQYNEENRVEWEIELTQDERRYLEGEFDAWLYTIRKAREIKAEKKAKAHGQ